MLPAARRRSPSAMRRYAYRKMHFADQDLACAANWTPFADALGIAPSAMGGSPGGATALAAALVVDQGKRLERGFHERRIFAFQSIESFAHCIRHPDLAIRIRGGLVVAGQFRRHRHDTPPCN